VALVDDPAQHDIASVGAAIEADYPDGLNVHLISVDDSSTISLRVWERGSGVTEACGSGAVAAGYAAATWGLVDGPIQVRMPGGVATVEAGDETIYLTGPARFVASVGVYG